MVWGGECYIMDSCICFHTDCLMHRMSGLPGKDWRINITWGPGGGVLWESEAGKIWADKLSLPVLSHSGSLLVFKCSVDRWYLTLLWPLLDFTPSWMQGSNFSLQHLVVKFQTYSKLEIILLWIPVIYHLGFINILLLLFYHISVHAFSTLSTYCCCYC